MNNYYKTVLKPMDKVRKKYVSAKDTKKVEEYNLKMSIAADKAIKRYFEIMGKK